MRYSIEAGSDTAMLLLFDPAALPDNFDEQPKENRATILEEAMLNGKAFLFNKDGASPLIDTDGEGSYLLHIFVDEVDTSDLSQFLRDEESVPSFHIPSGKLYFAGSEYAFRYDDSSLKENLMGDSISIDPGTYRLSLLRPQYPKGIQENELSRQFTRTQIYLGNLIGLLPITAFLGLGMIIGSAFYSHLRSPFHIPLGVLFLAIFFIAPQIPIYRKVDKARDTIASRYPSVVAHLTKL